MSVESEDAIREYVVRCATLIIDNSQALYWEVRQAAIDAVREGMGSGWERDDFVMMLGGRGQADRSEVAGVVGSAVCDRLHDLIVEQWNSAGTKSVAGVLLSMLLDLLDLEDVEQRRLFGEHYMPEESDWPEGDDDA